MADNVQITSGSGTVISTDECVINSVTVQVPRGKVGWGVDGTYVDASATNPLPVTAIPSSPAAGSYLPVRITDGSAFIASGTEYTEGDTATTPHGTAAFWISGTIAHAVSTSNPMPVSDAGGSFTVDAPVGTPVFVRLSDGTSAISTLPVSLASVPSHAVTNAGTFATQDSQLVAQNSTTSGQVGPLIQGAVTTAAPSYTTAKTSPLSLTTAGLLRVDGSGATQPVSGTVTANIGTAGTLALDASVTGLQVSQGSTTSGQKGNFILGAVTTSAPSYTTAQTSPLSLTTAGALRVDSSANTQPVSGTVTANAGTNLNTSLLALESGGNLATLAGAVTSAKVQANTAQINGVAPSMGNGVSGTGVQRVTLASDSTGTVAATQSGTWTLQPGNTANTTPWLVTDTPATSGGLSFVHVTAAASNNKTQIKGSAGQLFAIHAINLTATVKYIKVFNNTSAGVTAGTTSADYQFAIPANSTTGAGFVLELNKGVAHSTGITIMMTGAVSLTDNTSLAANDVVATFFYK